MNVRIRVEYLCYEYFSPSLSATHKDWKRSRIPMKCEKSKKTILIKVENRQ